MKTLIATLLATAAGAVFAAPTVALTHDPATYRNVTQKPEADYKAAVAKCDAMSGNDKNVCMAEAKVARTRTEADILSRYNTTPVSRERARTNMADAEYNLAKARCDGKAGADKDACMNDAKSVHTAALNDARTDRAGSTGGSGATAATGSTTTTTTTGGTAVLINNADPAANPTAASKTRDAAATVADKTKAVAATVAEKTREAADTAVEKTKQAASTLKQKTENTVDRNGDDGRQTASTASTSPAVRQADDTADRAGDKTAATGTKARVAASDTAITAKVKAGLIKEAKLDALGIHVETEKGTVMLSGFVNSKADADKALEVAKGVNGVGNVKSALQVK